jgi:ADP-ribose pyrophosphatase YjhB (NUDIX family)
MTEEKKRVGAGVGVILKRGHKILLGKRHPDPDKADSAFRSAGEWSLPGGKMDWGETFETVAAREVKEETGIIIKDPKVICVCNCKNEHAHYMTVGLLAFKFKGEARVMEPDEMTEWKWFDLNHLPSPRYFPSFMVINNFKKKKFYIKGS